ncbi:MAG: tetratricopeptide repeat protein [Chitinophagaceae bacterium]|nr:tetratricopeptide repeat protein [Anaerolineae bacterium]
MMLYKMVTGEIPFHGQTPPAFRQMLGDILPSPCVMRRDLPEAAGQIILKALAKEPEDRYPSCRMLAQAFEAVIRKFITLQESDTALFSLGAVPLISDENPAVSSDKTTTDYGRLGVQPEPHHTPTLQRRRTRLFLAGIGGVGLVLLIAVGSTMFPLSQGAAAIPVFAQGEVGVVFANFDYIDTDVAKVEPNLESEFESAGIPFIREDQVMTDRQEAQRISDLHNATIVIWGEVARGGVRLFFEITPRQGSVTTNLDQLEVSVADLDSFDTYIFQGMDTLYIVNLVIGQIDYFEGNYDHALAALNQAVALIPEERELDLEADALFLYRANIYSRLNDQESAIADYTQALELNPELAVALNNRAVAYMYSSRYDLAFIDLDRATELDPDFPFPYYNRGWMYSFLGEFTKAYDEFTQGFAVANK